MPKQFHWLGCLLLTVGLLVIPFTPTYAAHLHKAITQDTPPVAPGVITGAVDVVVVLDDSGSMATCWPWARDSDTPPLPPCGGAVSYNPPSDPADLRYSAARLLVQLADEADRIAVVRFDSAAEGVGLLGAPQPVGGADNRRLLTDSLQPPTEYGRRGYTRIDLGLEAAATLLQGVRQPGRDQYVLLLTDGEPTQPREAGDQRDRLQAQIAGFKSAGVFVFPVVLCNPTAGCSGEVLREQFAEYGVREAASAPDLLRVFSDILAEIKPDRSVISGRGGALQLTVRPAHGVRRITLVTARGGLLGVRRDAEVVLPRLDLNDANIDINLIEGEALAAGKWQAQTVDNSGFAVVQTDSFADLINPPPSLANSPAAVRYYPAGKPLLLMARSNGPGAAEPLLYNGKTPLQPFGQDNLLALLLKDEKPKEIRLQVGEDDAPLQLVRTFRLEARTDLPQVAIFSPTVDNPGLLDDGRARLQVGFGSAVVQALAATVYITDESGDEAGKGQLVYQAPMICDDRLCSDENFVPGDGRSYQVTYIANGQKEGVRFGDWGQV
ncbi:MAG: VWA domain-containing protein, partial [Chloroflexota bacterium]|nr:VWA domain-containing protein [Chloroflexota bacterium]